MTCILAEIILTKNSCCATSQYPILPEKSRSIFLLDFSFTSFSPLTQSLPLIDDGKYVLLCIAFRGGIRAQWDKKNYVPWTKII